MAKKGAAITLQTLADGQNRLEKTVGSLGKTVDNLANGQGRLEKTVQNLGHTVDNLVKTVDNLTIGQAKLVQTVDNLAIGQQHLEKGFVGLTKSQIRLEKTVEDLTIMVAQSFTEQQKYMDGRFDGIEVRLTHVEQTLGSMRLRVTDSVHRFELHDLDRRVTQLEHKAR